MRPASTDYAEHFAAYVSLVPEDDILGAIEAQASETQKLLASLDELRAGYRYAEGKWSIKEVIGHLIDAERIFGYRALAIARGDKQPLPNFDEKAYVQSANFDAWRISDLAELYALSRRSNIVFFRNLADEAWDRRGTASNRQVTVRAIAWIIVGHERHHMKVLHERYGV